MPPFPVTPSSPFETIAKTGITAFVVVAVLYGSFWLIKKVLDIYERHMQRMETRHENDHKDHREERNKWLETYAKYTEKIDQAMTYQRDEHQRMMSILDSLDRRFRSGEHHADH